MIISLRRALVGALAVGVIGGTALVAPAAQAAPQTPVVTVTPLPDATRGSTYEYRKLSKTKKKQVTVANYMLSKAFSKGKLDYKKANKYDKGETTMRRQAAAGVLWSGGKITNISKAEMAKVKKYFPKKKARGLSLANSRLLDRPACTGKSGWTTIYDKYGTKRGWLLRLNSCETDNVIIGAGVCTFVGGVVAVSGGGGPYTAGIGATAAICGLGGLVIDKMQDWSTTKSVAMGVISTPIGLTTAVTPQ